MRSYLRSELGYQSETPGNINRRAEETWQLVQDVDTTLRGVGGELGLAGWIAVIRRTWIALVALLGAAVGYLFNDLVEPDTAPPTYHISAPKR